MIVTKGKRWEFTTMEGFVKAWNELKDCEFSASMSDDFHREVEEKEEIQRQKKQVAERARALGLI